MKDKDAKIFVSSVNNISKRLEYYGDANLNNISLLKLIYKYSGSCTETSQLQTLDKMVSVLQTTDKDICMETSYSLGYVSPVQKKTIDLTDLNLDAPSITSVAIPVPNQFYYITVEELLAGYSSPVNKEASHIEIGSLPLNGTLSYENKAVTPGQIIKISEVSGPIIYERNSNIAYNTEFAFSAYSIIDQVPVKSNIATASVTVYEIVPENLPPTVGDTNIYVDNRTVRLFKIEDFTTSATPMYTDPEGNPLHSIRIDRIAQANEGGYYFYGSPVSIGQIITAEQINTGAFVYISADINSIQTDVLEVAVRDSANGEWVI